MVSSLTPHPLPTPLHLPLDSCDFYPLYVPLFFQHPTITTRCTVQPCGGAIQGNGKGGKMGGRLFKIYPSIHFSSYIQSSKPYTIFGGLVPVDDKISPWADRESKAFPHKEEGWRVGSPLGW